MKHFILLKTPIYGQTNQDMRGDRSRTSVLHLGLGDPTKIVADLESFHRERTDPAANTTKTTRREAAEVSQDTVGGALGGETAMITEEGNIHQKR